MEQPNAKCFLASTVQITKPSYRAKLKLAVRNVPFGQREWRTEIQHALLLADMRGMEFWTPPEEYPIPLVDEHIQSDRYIRDFLNSETCEHPAADKLIDLYFRLSAPRIARHFDR